MGSKYLSMQVFLVLAIFTASQAFAEDDLLNVVVDGPRLSNYEKELRSIYPNSDRIEEYSFLPREWGGLSLMGLIGRLVGDRAQKPFETIDTRRYIYRAYKGGDALGVSHGSTIKAPFSDINLHVFYNPDTSVRDVRIDNAPNEVIERLTSGGYLKQFVNRPAADFSVVIGRRGRIRDWGAFTKEARKPANKTDQDYFNSIIRGMRFNTAFVEIAYFVGQAPLGGSSPKN